MFYHIVRRLVASLTNLSSTGDLISKLWLVGWSSKNLFIVVAVALICTDFNRFFDSFWHSQGKVDFWVIFLLIIQVKYELQLVLFGKLAMIFSVRIKKYDFEPKRRALSPLLHRCFLHRRGNLSNLSQQSQLVFLLSRQSDLKMRKLQKAMEHQLCHNEWKCMARKFKVLYHDKKMY